MTDKPKRRWYQFSLWSLMVVVLTASFPCAWFAYQIKVVRDREQFKKTLFDIGGYVEWTKPEPPKIPWWRELLGDVGAERVCVPSAYAEEYRLEVLRLFPEAEYVPEVDP